METLTEELRLIAQEYSAKVCLRYRRQSTSITYTYRDLLDSSLAIAAWLTQAGVKKGDRVAIILENCPQWSMAYFGIAFCGGVAVPLDIQSSFDEVIYFLRDSGARIIFCSQSLSYRAQLEKVNFLEKIVVVDGDGTKGKVYRFCEVTEYMPRQIALPRINPGDLASIIYTSGTTARPKGVMLTHRNFYANFLSIKRLNPFQSSDTMLAVLPLHHSYAFMVTLIVPLFTGGEIVYLEGLGAESIVECLCQEHITVMAVVPQILYLFSRAIKEQLRRLSLPLRLAMRLLMEVLWLIRRMSPINPARLCFRRIHSRLGPHLRFFVCGGAQLDKKVELFLFKLGFTIIEGYGLTEAAPVVSFNPLNRPRIGSVGKALAGVEIGIHDPDADGVGQILVRGENVMKGYYRNQEETDQVLQGGWLYTQDLGFQDEQGYLFIRGRLKEVIVLSSGKNISPEEVEIHYTKSSFIKEICILPDEKEEKLVAVVVPDLEYFRKMNESNIYEVVKWRLEYLSQSLPSYKRIRSFILIDQKLPRTRLGKLKRFKIREIYREFCHSRPPSVGSEVYPEALSSTAEMVLETLKKLRAGRAIGLDDHLELDLGIDSLERVELLLALEKSFTIKLREEDLPKIFTVRELIGVLERLSLKREGDFTREDIAWREILGQEPSSGLKRRIEINTGLFSRVATILGAAILGGLCRLLFRLKVEGRKNFLSQRCIICPNHASYLDGFLIFASLPLPLKYNLFFMGLSRYFEVPLIRHLIRTLRVIPVDVSGNLGEAMKAASMVLKNDKILCIFPEGSRSVDGELKGFKKGVGILVKELDVRAIAVYIQGSYQAWSPLAYLPRPYPIRVIIGQPYSWRELRERGLKIDGDADDYEAVALGIREEVLRLKAVGQ